MPYLGFRLSPKSLETSHHGGQGLFEPHLSLFKFRNFAPPLFFVCLFGSLRRINPCGSLASDGIKLNMMKMEKVKIYRIK